MALGTSGSDATSWLLCRAGARLCAVPLEHVIEIMRVLPIEVVAGAPRFVRGMAVIRGSPVPVVDIGLLFGQEASASTRLVTVAIGERRVALSVEGVLGVRSMAAASLGAMPPLLRDAAGDAISAINTLDSELLLFLRAARIASEDLLAELNAETAEA